MLPFKAPGYAAHSKAAALKTPASSWQEWDQHTSRCLSLDLSRLWPVETLGSVLSVIHFVVKFGKRCSLFLQMISLPLPVFSPAGTPKYALVSSVGTEAPWALFTFSTPVSFCSSDPVVSLALS